MSKVTVYSSDTCPYCVAVKDYLKENKVEFEEKNVSQDKQARAELMEKGHMGVPVILIDDQEIVGFDQTKLAELLHL